MPSARRKNPGFRKWQFESKEDIMRHSGHSSYGHGGGRGHGGYSGGGFHNARTGAYVSPARASQHVGQSFGGYTKSQCASSGNFYMRPSSKH